MFSRVSFTIPLFFALACGGSRAGDPDGSQPPGPAAQACTREAKMCPDGSAVGRSGPDCAFAACPAGSGDAAASGECTAPAGCTGPQPLAPNSMCPDGKTMSGPYCADAGDGKCGWQMRECPT